MKKSVLTFVCVSLAAAVFGLHAIAAENSKTISKKPRAPYVSAGLRPCIAEYKKANYIGAMQDLIALISKEPNNTYAKYYLALTYTQLGYREKAQEIYKEIVESGNNEALAYYSQQALDCTGNPDEMCRTKGIEEMGGDDAAEMQDIAQFIKSGKKVHPAAQDRITSERMDRKIQADAYSESQRNKNRK